MFGFAYIDVILKNNSEEVKNLKSSTFLDLAKIPAFLIFKNWIFKFFFASFLSVNVFFLSLIPIMSWNLTIESFFFSVVLKKNFSRYNELGVILVISLKMSLMILLLFSNITSSREIILGDNNIVGAYHFFKC